MTYKNHRATRRPKHQLFRPSSILAECVVTAETATAQGTKPAHLIAVAKRHEALAVDSHSFQEHDIRMRVAAELRLVARQLSAANTNQQTRIAA